MAYTTINKSTDYFNTVLYTGNGSAGHSITGVGFQPDWLWIKPRSSANRHTLYDVIRGTNSLSSESNGQEVDRAGDGFTSIDSDGFTLNNGGSGGDVNYSGRTHVAWNWKAGGTASANSSGTISSSVSANTTAGFSVVAYTGTGSAGATVGHGLGEAPKLIIQKGRTGVTDDWLIYHHRYGATHGFALNNTTGATDSDTYFNDTAPTSTVFTIGNNGKVNTNGATHIAYCFAEKKGFSKFGTYYGTGNSDNGPFLFTGFKPAWLMIKESSSSGESWIMYDNKRSAGINVTDDVLFANAIQLEEANQTSKGVDFLSNGIKIRNTDNVTNGSAEQYIYMAFAEAPLVGNNNVPATAK